MPYQAPLKDMLFVMNELADLAGVIAPLNNPSDKEPSFWHDGQVTTSKGFKEAFKAFGEAGWQGVQHPVDFGGQGLPKLLATPRIEMLNAGSISFALVALLSDGAIEALMTAGSDELKATYLENLVSGKWTGTMK